MGIFNVTIAVANVHGQTFEDVDVTVDTACDYTTLPREMLQRLAVPVSGEAISEMAAALDTSQCVQFPAQPALWLDCLLPPTEKAFAPPLRPAASAAVSIRIAFPNSGYYHYLGKLELAATIALPLA